MSIKGLANATLTICITIGATACYQGELRTDLQSPYYRVPVQSVLALNRAVEIPPGRARVHIQRGETGEKFDPYYPHCSLEVTDVLPERSQIVRPGTFAVVRTQSVSEEVVDQRRPLMVAAASFTLAKMDDGGESYIYEGYHLWLENPEQPNVRRLTCRGVFDHPSLARPPSIAEIREALGDIAGLRLN